MLLDVSLNISKTKQIITSKCLKISIEFILFQIVAQFLFLYHWINILIFIFRFPEVDSVIDVVDNQMVYYLLESDDDAQSEFQYEAVEHAEHIANVEQIEAEPSAEINNDEAAIIIEQTGDIFKLDIDCFEESFDYLPFKDLVNVGETCKRLQRVAGYCYQQNYSAAAVSKYNGIRCKGAIY